MWIMTDVGFISIVKHHQIPDTMLVRGRVKADLKALFPGHAVETMPGADYLYRATIPTQTVAETLFYKVMGIDYESHVKDVAIKRSAPAEHGSRSHALYDTWSAFADLQEIAPYSKVARSERMFYSAPGKGTPIQPSKFVWPASPAAGLTTAELDQTDADAVLDAELDALSDEDFLVEMRARNQAAKVDTAPTESKRDRRNRKARERRQAGKDEGLASAV